MSFTSYSYRLRTSGPMSVGGGFVTHTFMAERSTVTTYEAITNIKNSSNMTGQGGDYKSISYNSLPYLLGGRLAFSGTEIRKPVIIDEGSIPGS